MYLDFEKYMSTLFECVEDEDWMGRPLKESIYKTLKLEHLPSSEQRENENMEQYKERMLRKS